MFIKTPEGDTGRTSNIVQPQDYFPTILNLAGVPIPEDLSVTCPDQTHVLIQGPDKQRVGQFSAEVRAVRKPEPYKGKGIRYEGEQVRRKAGKAMAK